MKSQTHETPGASGFRGNESPVTWASVFQNCKPHSASRNGNPNRQSLMRKRAAIFGRTPNQFFNDEASNAGNAAGFGFFGPFGKDGDSLSIHERRKT